MKKQRTKKQIIEKYKKSMQELHLSDVVRTAGSLCSAAVSEAIRYGLIVRPKKCSKCGEEKRIQGHHHNRNFPLRVTWLCSSCHVKIHKNPRNDAVKFRFK